MVACPDPALKHLPNQFPVEHNPGRTPDFAPSKPDFLYHSIHVGLPVRRTSYHVD
jgi:hypothetical protein